MVSRVGKFVGGFDADVSNLLSVVASTNRIALGSGNIAPEANVHIVGNAHVSTTFSTGGNITSGGSVTGTSADFDGGVTIDNITIDGTEIDLSSGDLTVDVAGKIILDAAGTGGFTEFHENGTAYGSIHQDSNNMRIRGLINGGDIILQGLDGSGSVVNMAQFFPEREGEAKLFNNLMLQSDGAFVKFGDNNDIDIIHVHEVGLTLSNKISTDNKPIVFQLKSTESTITADEVIASLEMAAGFSGGGDGAEVSAGIHAIAEGTFSTTANPTKLVFTTGVSESAAASATAKMTLSSAGLLTIADDFMIKDGGTIGVASTNDALTIASDGIVTFKDDIKIKDGGTIGSATTPAAITVASDGIVTFADDIKIKNDGTIGSAGAATAMTIDSSGIVTFVDDIKIKDDGTIGSASAATAMTIDSSGIVTFVDDIKIKDGGTIGVASAADAMTVSSAGIVTFKDDILIKDGGTIGVASKADAITVASDGKVTLVDDAAVTGNAIVSLGLGLAGNTIPSSDGVSFGTPANVVIRTFAGSGNVIIGDATATSGFSLDVRGTANTGALTASGLAFPTSDGNSGQVIKTDGSGALSFTDIATDLDPATELASDTDCGTATSATDSVDAFGIAINNSFVELDLRTQGANKLGTVDMGAF